MEDTYRLEQRVGRSTELAVQNFDGLTTFELERLATRMLRTNGFDKYGRRNTDSSQKSFEYRMRTGAFARNSERRRK